jgi:hypothetical protein
VRRVAGFTVSVVEPDMLPDVAAHVMDPTVTDVAKPPALTIAMLVLDELQITCVVISWVVLSENVPVAVSCCVVPMGVLGFVGVIVRVTSVALVTVSVVLPEVLPNDAQMVVVPERHPYAYTRLLIHCPSVVEWAEALATTLIVDTLVSDELQVTESVKSCVVLSEYIPVAVNDCVVFSAI